MRPLLDPELLEALDSLRSEQLEIDVWRVTWASRDPVMGSSGGGRWSPDNGFEALYTSFSENGAIAEVYHHLSNAPVFSSSHVRAHRIQVSLEKVLKLDSERLKSLGIKDPVGTRIDYDQTQSIGAAAHLLDYEGIVVPSARWDCMNLVLFLDRIDIGQQLKVQEQREVNWPAWAKANRNKSA